MTADGDPRPTISAAQRDAPWPWEWLLASRRRCAVNGKRQAVDGDDPAYIRRRAEDRLHILDGLLRAIDSGWALVEAIERSATRGEARDELTAPRFGFSVMQAEHVLDLTLGLRTQHGRALFQTERDELQSLIDGL